MPPTQCPLCHGTDFVETVSDLVCRQCGLCLGPKLSQENYVLEGRFRRQLDECSIGSQRGLVPLDPKGTLVGGLRHPQQRKNNWHLNHDGETQGIQRMRDRVRALSRSLGLNEALETAAYQLSLRVLSGNVKQGTDRYIRAAIVGIVGTIRSRHLPISMRHVLRAVRQHGRPGLHWHTLTQVLLNEPAVSGLLGPQSPHTYLPPLLEQALTIIAAHNGHAPNGLSLRAQLTQLSETFLATTHSRPGAHPQIVAAASLYLACHELLHPCPIKLHSFEPTVNRYSLRSSGKLDFHWRDCRR